MPTSGRAEPAFRRLWSDLRSQILSGTFDADTPLPTEARLTQDYSVSRQTVRRAFQDLVAEGLVHRVPGRGTFATPATGRYLRQFGSIEDLLALSSDSEMRVHLPLGLVIDPIAASRLRLPDDRVERVTFVRLHAGEAFSHTSVYLPPDVGAAIGRESNLAESGSTSPTTVIGLLDQHLTHAIREAEQSITVGTASGEVSTALHLDPGTPLLRIDRTYLDATDRPVELAVSYFHPDRYSYRVRLRRSFN